jgi:MFS family permease
MPFYLIHPSGLPVDRVGYMMVIPFVFLFFVSPVAGTISDRIGSRLLCTLGMVVLVFSLFCLAALDGRASALSIAWRLALAGAGIALFLPPNSAVALSAVPSHRRGIASGTVATARNLGMVLGVATSALIFNSIFQSLSGGLPFKVYHSALEPHFMTAFRYALQAGGLVAVGGVIVTYLRGHEPNAASETAPGA